MEYYLAIAEMLRSLEIVGYFALGLVAIAVYCGLRYGFPVLEKPDGK
jgi:hypothetical protein